MIQSEIFLVRTTAGVQKRFNRHPCARTCDDQQTLYQICRLPFSSYSQLCCRKWPILTYPAWRRSNFAEIIGTRNSSPGLSCGVVCGIHLAVSVVHRLEMDIQTNIRRQLILR